MRGTFYLLKVSECIVELILIHFVTYTRH